MNSQLYHIYHKRYNFWLNMANKTANLGFIAKGKKDTLDMFRLFSVQSYCTMRAQLAESCMEKALMAEKTIKENFNV